MAPASLTASDSSSEKLVSVVVTGVEDEKNSLLLEAKNVYLSSSPCFVQFTVVNNVDEAITLDFSFTTRDTVDSAFVQVNFQPENPNVELDDDYNELFNKIEQPCDMILEAHESQSVTMSFAYFENTANENAAMNSKSSASNLQDMHKGNSFFKISGRVNITSKLKENASVDSKLSIPFKASVCRSVLDTDVSQLVFDDCVPGGAYFKDLTIWNRSEIPLIFRILPFSTPEVITDNLLELSEYETGKALDEAVGGILSVAGYNHLRIRVSYKPVHVSELSGTLIVENVHDIQNTEKIKIHTLVTPHLHEEGLLVLREDNSAMGSSSVLSMGDCHYGVHSSKVIRLKNLTEVPLDVHLSSDQPEEVSFGLLTQMRPAHQTGSVKELSDEDDSADEDLDLDEDDDEDLDEDDDDGLDDDDDNDSRLQPESEENREVQLEEELETMESETAASVVPGNSSKRDLLHLKHSHMEDLANESLKEFLTSRMSSSHADGKKMMSPREASAAADKKKHSKKEKPSIIDGERSRARHGVEMLSLDPGTEQKLVVWYCAKPTAVDDGDTSSDLLMRDTHFRKRVFRMVLSCRDSRSNSISRDEITDTDSHGHEHMGDKYSRTILGQARACLSYISTSPSHIMFGDCNIGVHKSSSFKVINHSDSSTKVAIRVLSRVVSVSHELVELAPRQTVDVGVDFVPRKINPSYSRDITVSNLNNKLNSRVVQVRASNMDPHHLIYHSLFYKLTVQDLLKRDNVESSTQFFNHNNKTESQQGVQFGQVVIHSPNLRVVSITNITEKTLKLELSTSKPNEIKLFVDCESLEKHLVAFDDAVYETLQPAAEDEDFFPFEDSSTVQQDDQFPEIGAPKLTSALSLDASQISVDKRTSISSGLSVELQKLRHRRTTFSGNTPPKSMTVSPLMAPEKRSSSFDMDIASPLNRMGRHKFVSVGSAESFIMRTPGTLGLGDAVATPKTASIPIVKESKSESLSDKQQAKTNLLSTSHEENGTKKFESPQKLNSTSSSRAKSAKSTSSMKQRWNLEQLSESFSKTQPVFYSGMEPQQEHQFTREASTRIKELKKSIADGKLLAIDNGILVIAPHATVPVGIVFTPVGTLPNDETVPDIKSGKLRNSSETIYIKLLDLDSEDIEHLWNVHQRAIPASGDSGDVNNENPNDEKEGDHLLSLLKEGKVPLRELHIQSNVGMSIMSFAQHHINFGKVHVNSSSRTRTIVINNESAVPLHYRISKSGSISSSFLHIIKNSFGVIRPYGSKEVQFVFQPTLPGPINETLTVVNVLDSSASKNISVKAYVYRPERFALVNVNEETNSANGDKPNKVERVYRQPSYALNIDNKSSGYHFGDCYLDFLSTKTQKLMIKNTSNRAREFLISIKDKKREHLDEAKPFQILFEFKVLETSASVKEITEEVEEQIEHVEHKLRIAIRKEHHDKVKKFTLKLSDLKTKYGISNEPINEQIDGHETPTDSNVLAVKDSFLISVPDGSTVHIRLRALIRWDASCGYSYEEYRKQMWKEGNILVKHLSWVMRVFEVKNEDNVKEVTVSCNLLFDGLHKGNSFLSHLNPDLLRYSSGQQTSSGFTSPTNATQGSQEGESSMYPDLSEEVTSIFAHRHDVRVDKGYRSLSNSPINSHTILNRTPPPTTTTSAVSTPNSKSKMSDNSYSMPMGRSKVGSAITRTGSSQRLSAMDDSYASIGKPLLDDHCLLEVTPNTLLLDDRLICDQVYSKRFELHNIAKKDYILYTISMESDKVELKNGNSSGSLQPNEIHCFDFNLKFSHGGLQSTMITIEYHVNSSKSEVLKKILVIRANVLYIQFPDLDAKCTGKPSSLDLGLIYAPVPPKAQADDWRAWIALKPAKIVPLTVKNIFNKKLLLATKSNLKRQVYVYQNEELTKNVENVVLDVNSSLTVYICVRPRLLEDSWNGACRRLTGGITFFGNVLSDEDASDNVNKIDDNVKQFECTVSFESLVGISIMELSSTYIDLGRLYFSQGKQDKKLLSCRGKFVIENKTRKMPLHFNIQLDNEIKAETDSTTDEIDDLMDIISGNNRPRSVSIQSNDMELILSQRQGVIDGGKSMEMDFIVKLNSCGLFSRQIHVINESFVGESISSERNQPIKDIHIEVLVEDGMLRSELYSPLGAALQLSSTSDHAPFTIVPLNPFTIIPETEAIYNELNEHFMDKNSDKIESYNFLQHQNDLPFNNIYIVRLSNEKSHHVKLYAFCRSAMQISVNYFSSVEDLETVYTQINSSQNSSDASCIDMGVLSKNQHDLPLTQIGNEVTLKSNASIYAVFNFDQASSIHAHPNSLFRDSGIALNGLIFFASVNGKVNLEDFRNESTNEQYLEYIANGFRFSGLFQISRFEISNPKIDVGKIGVVNHWCDTFFDITLNNITGDVPLVYQVELVAPCFTSLKVDCATRIFRFNVNAVQQGQSASFIEFVEELDSDFNSLISNPQAFVFKSKEKEIKLSFAFAFDEKSRALLESNPGKYSFQLKVKNCNNPYNEQIVDIETHVVSKLILLYMNDDVYYPTTVEQMTENKEETQESTLSTTNDEQGQIDIKTGSAGDKEFVLDLPPLTVPSPPSEHPLKCNSWYTICNVYDQALNIKVNFSEVEDYCEIIEYSILSRISNTALPDDGIMLWPGEKIDLRVVIRSKKGVRLPESIGVSKEDQSILPIELGVIKIVSSAGDDEHVVDSTTLVGLRGVLKPGVIFTLSASRLIFYTVEYKHNDKLNVIENVSRDRVTPLVKEKSISTDKLSKDGRSDTDQDDGYFVDSEEGLQTDKNDDASDLHDNSTDCEPSSAYANESVFAPRDSDDVDGIDSSGITGGTKIRHNHDSKVIRAVRSKRLPKSARSMSTIAALSRPATKVAASIQLSKKSLCENFWIKNISDSIPLHFQISCSSMYKPGLHLLLKQTANEVVITDSVTPDVTPRNGEILPNNAVQVTVTLSPDSLRGAIESYDQDEMFIFVYDVNNKACAPTKIQVTIEPDTTVAQEETPDDISLKDRGVEEDISIVETEDGDAAINDEATESNDIKSAISTTKVEDTIISSVSKAKKIEKVLADRLRLNKDEFENKSLVDSAVEKEVPVIKSDLLIFSLRGCTPVTHSSKRYEINIGQRDFDTGNVEWELNIETTVADKKDDDDNNDAMLKNAVIEFSLYTADTSDGEWVTLSRDKGKLKGSHDYASVTLYFATGMIGNFSTYLVVENLNNYSDTKFIHISMEVALTNDRISRFTAGGNNMLPSISSRALNRSKKTLFLVRIRGGWKHESSPIVDEDKLDTYDQINNVPLEINMGMVPVGWLSSYYSFVITNCSAVSMTFLLAHNVKNDGYKLHFSSSVYSLCEINEITLSPGSEVRVYIFLIPQVLYKKRNEGNESVGKIKRFISDSSINTSSSLSRFSSDIIYTFDVDLEVYITCRLIKNFHKTLKLKALAITPIMELFIIPQYYQHSSLYDDLKVVSPNIEKETVLAYDRFIMQYLQDIQSKKTHNNTLQDPVVHFVSTAFLDDDEDNDGNWMKEYGCVPRELIIRNSSNSVMGCCVLNDTAYFHILLINPAEQTANPHLDASNYRGVRDMAIVMPKSYVIVRITPKYATLERNKAVIRKTKRVEENIILYNCTWNTFHEMKRVTLKFAFGEYRHYNNFFSWKNCSRELTILEERITLLLCDFANFWKYFDSEFGSSISNIQDGLQEIYRYLYLHTLLIIPNAETESADDDEIKIRTAAIRYARLYFNFHVMTYNFIYYARQSHTSEFLISFGKLLYGVALRHDIFKLFMPKKSPEMPLLLQDWIRLLGMFLGFFPNYFKNIESLRELHYQLNKKISNKHASGSKKPRAYRR